MRFLLDPIGLATLAALTDAATAARESGLDGISLTESAALPSPLIAAAALAGRVEDVLVAAEITLGDRHPLEVAEEAAVTDLALDGRLILVARPATDDLSRFAEALDIVRLACAPRPFRFEGNHWQVPANLPENEWLPEEQVRLMPGPPLPRLELWTAGAAARPLAIERGLGHLIGADDDPGAGLAQLTKASELAPRARREQLTDPLALVERLREGREWGQDWAVVSAPASAAPDLGSIVRPRVQMHKLSPGLEAFWDTERPWAQ